MTELKNINKIIGATTIGLNIFIYIPWTWEIIMTGGGNEGWGLIFLPTTFAFHLFIITGIFSFLDNERLNKKIFKTTLLSIWFLLSLITLINFGWIATLVMATVIIIFFSLIGLTVHRKLNIEKSILITNSVGSLGMIATQLLLNL